MSAGGDTPGDPPDTTGDTPGDTPGETPGGASDVGARRATWDRRDSGTRVWNVVDTTAPPERLAMLRVLVALFATAYLTVRFPVFWQLGERRGDFDGVGVAALLDRPLPAAVVRGTLAVTLVCGVATVAGWRSRVCAPAVAVGMLVLTTYRSSWGQLLHFENLCTLHLAILAAAPVADAWSLDARRRARSVAPARPARPARPVREPTAYGWPIALCALVVIVTYVIAGIAKLRYGGIDWVLGDSLRNHVAYAAARNELVGAPVAPLADEFVDLAARVGDVWPLLAAGALALELGAPLALFGGRMRTAWVVAVWAMHIGILLTMRIGFPYPLFGVAFAPFFRIEGLVRPVERLGGRLAGRVSGR